ncbi:MAG: polyphosphate kinase 2 family protein [Megasphaera sp.]|jgi:PPK2 family polyphosphate:nucleotide phosphotransferase|nr:polyphosphate kinase 2 family protein [Megasphaera sp.]MCI1248510.1 polyphosphate kinase 2 family protein [Megasphaera sp.]
MDVDVNKYLVKEGTKVDLSTYTTACDVDIDKNKVKHEFMPQTIDEINTWQEKLYAAGQYGLLIVLQAMDAAGKDGTIKHVFGPLNPAGVHVHSFKQPSVEEKDHDYMWRINKALPSRGEIGIFNRSHYEDVVVTNIHNLIKNAGMPEKLIKKNIWEQRYRQIRDWERYLVENGFPIIKIFLHVSKNEQKKRLIDRIVTKQKNWKFAMSDIHERKYWDRYQKVYGEVISATSTKQAPWYIVPADDKWYTRYVVSLLVLRELQKIRPAFPKLSADVESQLNQFRQLLKSVDLNDLKNFKSAIDKRENSH